VNNVAVDTSRVAQLDVEPGELPASMAAWVIREERFGEPLDAFQLEEMPVPEPGAYEVVVRVMAAGVNFNNVWAALGKPVSVFRYRQEDHHIGGSDASGIVWKVGKGVTRWKPGDEVVIHCNQASYEDVEVHGLDPLAAPSQQIWGYETTWGSFAQFCKVQAQQLLRKPRHLAWEEAASYGLTFFTAYRMLVDQVQLQSGDRVLVWGAAGGLGVFATQLCRLAGADCVGVVSSEGKAELVRSLGAVATINRKEFAGMMRRGDETPDEEREREREARRFSKHVRDLLGGAPDVVFEHVGRATFPTSVLTVKPFGKVVICGATSGYTLDFDVRYLWMRQKQIIGSHFANAYEATRANELIECGKIRPVLWKTMPFDGVAEAHQSMYKNEHLGKIAILVGAEAEGLGRTGEGPGAIHAEVGA
jgi:crotonyl-CoA carboxylase/reductase